MDPIQQELLEEMNMEEIIHGDKDGELIDIAMGADPVNFSLEDELENNTDLLMEAYSEKKIF